MTPSARRDSRLLAKMIARERALPFGQWPGLGRPNSTSAAGARRSVGISRSLTALLFYSRRAGSARIWRKFQRGGDFRAARPAAVFVDAFFAVRTLPGCLRRAKRTCKLQIAARSGI